MEHRHQLEREQVLPISLETAWAFFSSPQNLDAITPPDMGFRIVSLESPEMHEGQLIEYRVRLAPLVWTKWVSEIREVEPGRQFVDVQKAGPYKRWHHRHTFEAVEGGVRMRDVVDYEVGWGILGEIAHAVFVRRKLGRIFDFRREALEERFAQGGAPRRGIGD